jgi:hypothetical protein
VACYSRRHRSLSSLLPPARAYHRGGDSADPSERFRLDMEEQRMEAVLNPGGPGPLGLSSIPKSVDARRARGSGGMTSYGRQRVKDAAYLIEMDSPRSTVVLWTVTVPPGLEQETLNKWARLTDLVRNSLRKALVRQGLPGDLLFVSEYQEEREEKYGRPVLHLHFLFRGAHLAGRWVLTVEAYKSIWVRALRAVCGSRVDNIDTSACSRCEAVRKSCASYLGKYMSKGCKGVPRVSDNQADRGHPSSWFGVGQKLARRVLRGTRRIRGPIAARAISALLGSPTAFLRFSRWVSFPGASGEPVWIAWYGDLLDPRALDGLFPVLESS